MASKKAQFTSDLWSLVNSMETTNIYFVGSARWSHQNYFNNTLSDLDLLVLPLCKSSDDYINQLRLARDISTHINSKEEVVDLFFMNASIATRYFSCLSVVWGFKALDKRDLIFTDSKESILQNNSPPSISMRQQLYIAKAWSVCHEYSTLLPLADTQQARKVAKTILKALKLIICARVPIKELEQTEERLFVVNDFKTAIGFLNDDAVNGWETIRSDLQATLDGYTIEDWSSWMVTQESAARLLEKIIPYLENKANNRRLHAGVCRIWDMLTLELKNVLMKTDDNKYRQAISKFADQTTSVIVKCALSGVDSLGDFEKYNTPSLVIESYERIVDHLQATKEGDTQLLASSLILLEYAFQQSTNPERAP